MKAKEEDRPIPQPSANETLRVALTELMATAARLLWSDEQSQFAARPPETPFASLAGGEMAERIRRCDWSSISMVPFDLWPLSLSAILRLMLSSKLPMYIAWGPEFRLIYNDAYGAILGAKHPSALGQPMASVWPEAWSELEPGLRDALAGKASFSKDAPRWLRRGALERASYFIAAKSPITGEDGRIGGVYCACFETTADFATREASAQESEHLRDLFSHAPSFMAVLRGPEHVFEIANLAYQEIAGREALLGRPIREALPELTGQGVFETLDRVYASGERVIGKRVALNFGGHAHTRPSPTYVDVIYQPLFDAFGRPSGIFLEGNDVTEAALAHERIVEAERFLRATTDSLPQHIAVLDPAGKIVAVNKAWRDLALEHGGEVSALCEGADYLGVCDRAAKSGFSDAAKIATIIREVASGQRDAAAVEYACPSLTRDFWFTARISRFLGVGPANLVISHEDITERHERSQRIEYLANYDVLTKLPNRNLLAVRAEEAIDRALAGRLGVALLFIDLDNFKHLNEAYGPAVGDAALATVAAQLLDLAGARGTVSRAGGDQFVILLADTTDARGDAVKLARDILSQRSRTLKIGEREMILTASVGVSLFPDDAANYVDLLKNADAATEAAKHGGRNACRFYAPEMGARINERLQIEIELRRALKLGEFELYYQPQIHMATGAVVGVEALIRWRRPGFGLVLPGKFIAVAEETGLIMGIGEWALKKACEARKTWEADGIARFPVAVNISPIQLGQPDFVETLSRTLEQTGLDPALLELEITEGMVTNKTESMIGRLHDVSALGVSLSVDDFGTGYSNLGYLASFPLSKIKIDRSFVSNLHLDPRAASITRAIVAMAHGLGLGVIAEGVEKPEQAKRLEEIGCALAQGYLFSRPLDAKSLEIWLENNNRRSTAAPLLCAGYAHDDENRKALVP